MAVAQHEVKKITTLIDKKDTVEQLRLLSNNYPGQVIFSSSFSLEDQAISHFIFSNHLDIEVFTLDTGRFFPETYSTWSRTLEIYQQKITAFYPNEIALQRFVSEKGPNSFYESVENRKECCFIRKVEPLRLALRGKKIWVTGIRATHSPNRKDMAMVEWDESNSIIKFHPLLNWKTNELNDFIDSNRIPYNPLHDKGFVSIGCAPCTRALKEGEDFRAGRWWWENNTKKECGLHTETQHKKMTQ